MGHTTLSIASGKLTKSFLFSVPSGNFIASNVGWPSIYANELATTVPERLAQWKEIVAARANGRLCYIYASREHYLHKQAMFIAQLIREGRPLPETESN